MLMLLLMMVRLRLWLTVTNVQLNPGGDISGWVSHIAPKILKYPASFRVQWAKWSGYMPDSFGLASLLKGRVLLHGRRPSLFLFFFAWRMFSSEHDGRRDAALLWTGCSHSFDKLSGWQIGLQAHYWHPTDWRMQRNDFVCRPWNLFCSVGLGLGLVAVVNKTQRNLIQNHVLSFLVSIWYVFLFFFHIYFSV